MALMAPLGVGPWAAGCVRGKGRPEGGRDGGKGGRGTGRRRGREEELTFNCMMAHFTSQQHPCHVSMVNKESISWL